MHAGASKRARCVWCLINNIDFLLSSHFSSVSSYFSYHLSSSSSPSLIYFLSSSSPSQFLLPTSPFLQFPSSNFIANRTFLISSLMFLLIHTVKLLFLYFSPGSIKHLTIPINLAQANNNHQTQSFLKLKMFICYQNSLRKLSAPAEISMMRYRFENVRYKSLNCESMIKYHCTDYIKTQVQQQIMSKDNLYNPSKRQHGLSILTNYQQNNKNMFWFSFCINFNTHLYNESTPFSTFTKAKLCKVCNSSKNTTQCGQFFPEVQSRLELNWQNNSKMISLDFSLVIHSHHASNLASVSEKPLV